METIVDLKQVEFAYGPRRAVDGVSFAVRRGECFGLLGPNGGGKTTLFRILATLLKPSGGRATICGHDVVTQRTEVRRRIGVVFQSPSLDVYLTARSNLRHGGRLYGLGGADLEERITAGLRRFDVADRADDLVRTLSGGLKRRVEVAKALLHGPEVLLLDEPSTGLDPAAKSAVWQRLDELRADGVTVLVTTHHMDEAERCDRVGILDRGKLLVCDAPAALKACVGDECITIDCADPAGLRQRIVDRFGCSASVVDGGVRIERGGGGRRVAELTDAFGAEIRSITMARPTLEDVFMHETGRRFVAGDSPAVEQGRSKVKEEAA